MDRLYAACEGHPASKCDEPSRLSGESLGKALAASWPPQNDEALDWAEADVSPYWILLLAQFASLLSNVGATLINMNRLFQIVIINCMYQISL
jgi:hypothetical protein